MQAIFCYSNIYYYKVNNTLKIGNIGNRYKLYNIGNRYKLYNIGISCVYFLFCRGNK